MGTVKQTLATQKLLKSSIFCCKIHEFVEKTLHSCVAGVQEAQENDDEFQDLFPMTSVFAQGSWTEELQQQQQRKDARNANLILTAASSMASIGTAVSLDTD